MIRPAPCPERHEAVVSVLDSGSWRPSHLYRVYCSRMDCWDGPRKSSRAAAVRAWNRAMAKKKGGGE